MLNKRMKDAATNLEFEEAAKIRDEIRNLRSIRARNCIKSKSKTL